MRNYNLLRSVGRGLAAVWILSGLGVSRSWGQTPSPPDGPARRVGGTAPGLEKLFPPGVTQGTAERWTLRGRNLGRVERVLISGVGVEVLGFERASEALVVRVRARGDAPLGVPRLRVDGPTGVSNAVEFQVDRLAQGEETEPNDDPREANEVHPEEAIAGVLGPEDLDHFRVRVDAGSVLAFEVQARRLGTPVTPVVTLFDQAGRSLAQARQSRGLEGDCRLTYRFRKGGEYVVQVRDQLYGGGTRAVYRLRADGGPYASALFPLGGRAGDEVAVAASGGNLRAPVTRSVRLPERPEETLDPGPFEAQGGSFVVPQRLVAGAGEEILEEDGGTEMVKLPLGATANGRIDREGQVDRYVVKVAPGERLRVRLVAARLGSWLDSVVALEDNQGRVLAENDDAPGLATELVRARFPKAIAPDTDSALDHECRDGGNLVISVRDRHGRGGLEYAYRLTVEPSRPDFAVAVVLGGGGDESPGVVNLAPGEEYDVPVAVLAEGRTGSITLRARGLPPGVAADPLVLVPRGGARGKGKSAGTAPRERLGGRLRLRAAAGARPCLGALTIVATAGVRAGRVPTRAALFWIEVGSGSLSAPSRPLVRELGSVPVRVVDPGP